jgi:hypothetical protein
MWFLVQLSEKFDYYTVKNCWLGEFYTLCQDPDEGEFYIFLDSAYDVLEVSNLVGEDITVTSICDTPIIII